MLQVTATKRFEFDAAHRLEDYEGPCSNIHGHHYVVDITVGPIEADSCLLTDPLYKQDRGMVKNFSEIKDIVKPMLDEWDHGLLFMETETGSEFMQAMDLLDNMSMKLVPLDFRPTAENMAVCICRALMTTPEIRNVKSVRVYETPTCWAEVTVC